MLRAVYFIHTRLFKMPVSKQVSREQYNMRLRKNLVNIGVKIAEKFNQQFGFPIIEVTIKKITDYLHTPKDSSSLAVTRILFGLAMLFDIPDERGGAVMDQRWGNPKTCHFPLVPFIQAMPMPYMGIVYGIMWLGALGIILGFKYRISAAAFTIGHWYLLLIDKSFWNNHSYLFGLVALLLSLTQANCYWSLDSYLNPLQRKDSVPYWNYFILKYQFFILYFMAGLKKGTAEWLTGYSVPNLSMHWVFSPFKLFLTVPQIDFLIVHCFIFVFDLTVAIWMMWSRTRHVAMLFCALFHLMNTRLFSIGMFPWVCLATMPLFYPCNWPKLLQRLILKRYGEIKIYFRLVCRESENNKAITKKNKNEFEMPKNCSQNCKDIDNILGEIKEPDSVLETKNKINGTNDTNIFSDTKINRINKSDDVDNKTNTSDGNNITTLLIVLFVISQAFLPYSHFITKGYNNWTNGLYGYSWDMMVHTWDTNSIVVKVVDNDRNKEIYVDPNVFTPNDRWSRHGDMVYQYANCLRNNMLHEKQNGYRDYISDNFSIYIDVWCSMNGRFTQRMFDPNVDLLKVSWSPFQSLSFLMPLLDDALSWRSVLNELRKEIHSWNKYIDVIFIAEFPGYEQDKYIPIELTNVTLTVLEGVVAYEEEVTKLQIGQTYKLTNGSAITVAPGIFHKVTNIGQTPAYYMYTFVNTTEIKPQDKHIKPKLPVGKELSRRLWNMIKFARLVVSSIFQLFFLPMSSLD